MTEHPTPGPTDTVHLHAGEPSAAADTTAAFTNLVCADHELLRAEFDAIIAANFPDAADGTQRRRPTRPVVPGAGRGRRATLPPVSAPCTTGWHRQRAAPTGPAARAACLPTGRLGRMTARATEQAEQGGS